MDKIIDVKNAQGDLDTKATIIHQNNINYTPKVSVIIPVYNTEKYLRECLDSVINQTLKEIEIICVDDGSTDSSLDILKEYANKDNRFTIITQQNLHAGVARNAGLAVAKGEYVHFLDSDDWLDLDTYSKLYEKIEQQSVEFIKFKSFCFDNKLKKVIPSYFTDIRAVDPSLFNKKINFKKDYKTAIKVSDAPWSGLYKRSFLNKNNIFFDNLLCANDTSFFIRCLTKAKEFFLYSERFVYYRINNSESLVGIRAYNFDCQLKQYENIEKIVSAQALKIKNYIRQHFAYNIFFRYAGYMKNENLDFSAKKKIFDEMKVFCKKNNRIKISKEHKSYFEELLSDNIAVSVVVPVYNAEKYLTECLNSVCNQTLRNIEILCVNDCSSDNSLEILKEFSKKDYRVKIINNDINFGSPGRVKNIALQVAKGEYIGFVDSDDWIDLNYFEKLYKSAKKNNAEVAVATHMKKIHIDKQIKVDIKIKNKILKTLTEKGELIKKNGSNCNKIFNREFINRNNIICYEEKSIAEDNYFSILAILFSNKVAVTSDVIYYYRQHENSFTAHIRTDKDFNIIDAYQRLRRTICQKIKQQKLQEKYLISVKEREKQEYIWFINDLDLQYVEGFKQKLKQEAPDVYSNIFINNLIISLTSFPARINSVHLTIESLLNQSLHADKIILWLAEEQFPNKEADLPQSLLNLKGQGLTIDWYKDIRSYKKLIPTLKKYPNSIIVTADDDNIYPKQWLQKLYDSYLKYPKDVQAHRISKFFYKHGFEVIAGGQDYYKKPSYLNKLVGLGGVLYPPNCFYKDILNEELFMKLAPTNDDQWFWLQAVLNGTKIRVVENPEIKANYVEGTQQYGLTNINDKGEKLFWKDFHRLLEYYPQLKNILLKEAKKMKNKNIGTIDKYKKDLETWYEKVTKKDLDLENPQTYNEKIQWMKIYDSTPIKTRLADKYLVRDWVKEKIGEEYLIPLLGVYDSFDEIDFDKLPNQFVIKCNHGCAYNIIVKDKNNFDKIEAKEKINKWMSENFAFQWGVELHYLNIQRKIIIEKYIENSGNDLYDYKFWCFDGKVEYIQFLSERNTNGLKMAFYDKNWNKQDFVYSYPLDTKNIQKPNNLDKMIELAEKLSQDFPHVRVDFYRLDDGQIYFGEMTFTSASGSCKWNNKEINKILGKKIKLPKLAYNVDTGEYYKLPNYKLKRFLQNIFSLKNHSNKKHKILTVLGVKIKMKRKQKGEYSFIENIFSIKNKESKNNKWYKVIAILGIKFKFKNKDLTLRKNLEYQRKEIENQNKNIAELEYQLKNEIKIAKEQRSEFKKEINCTKSRMEELKKDNNALKCRYDGTIKRITPQANLRSFVYHLADHCNLKCWGCDHFSPLAKEKLADIGEYEKDVKRLSELTSQELEIIKLMGGEPLLHPEINKFMEISRRYFPKTRIEIVTNGLLLNAQKEEFWSACKEYDITIVPTKYPMNIDYDKAKETAKNHGVKYEYYGCTEEVLKTSYHIPLDPKGEQNAVENFANCFHANNCVMLKSGRLYTCTVAPNIEHFNNHFGCEIPLTERDGIDIHGAQKIEDVLEFLARPIPFCKYCNVKGRSFNHAWKTSDKEIKEWTL